MYHGRQCKIQTCSISSAANPSYQPGAGLKMKMLATGWPDLSIHVIAHQLDLGREVKSWFARALSETASLVLYDTNSGVFERKYASEGGVKLNITLSLYYHQLPSYQSAISIIEVAYAGICWQPGFSNVCRHFANSLLEFVREAKSRLTTGALSETASLAWHNMWRLRSQRNCEGPRMVCRLAGQPCPNHAPNRYRHLFQLNPSGCKAFSRSTRKE